MAQITKKPTDFTGRQQEILRAKHAEELKRREAQISMAQQIQIEEDEKVQDLVPEVRIVEEDGKPVTVEQPTKVIRVNTTLESMTFGAGNHYHFEEGKQYRVSPELAYHLEELGYVWH